MHTVVPVVPDFILSCQSARLPPCRRVDAGSPPAIASGDEGNRQAGARAP